jgi:hypothetical protein
VDVVFNKKKEAGSIIENMLVALVGMVLTTAFLVIIFGAFASISDKWRMNQVAREYMLLMETEGYLTAEDKVELIKELEACGLYNISLSGTTVSEVGYGNRIYLKISGTYDNNVLRFAGGISKVTTSPSAYSIERRSTAKQ